MNEIMTLINSTLTLMDQIENHIFTNHRAKYAGSKIMFDNYREEIEDMRKLLNSELSEAQLTELKNNLANMTQNTNDARESGILEPLPNVPSFNTTIGNMITQLDNNTPETVLPTANIDVQAMENAIPSMDVQPQAEPANVQPQVEQVASEETATVPPMPEIPGISVLEGGQDVIPQVEQVVIQEAPVNEVVYEATPAPQILDNVQTEVVQTVTPDIVITADEPNQMSSIAPTIEIPNVEPMIQVPNVEIPANIGIPDTNQEAGA